MGSTARMVQDLPCPPPPRTMRRALQKGRPSAPLLSALSSSASLAALSFSACEQRDTALLSILYYFPPASNATLHYLAPPILYYFPPAGKAPYTVYFVLRAAPTGAQSHFIPCSLTLCCVLCASCCTYWSTEYASYYTLRCLIGAKSILAIMICAPVEL